MKISYKKRGGWKFLVALVVLISSFSVLLAPIQSSAITPEQITQCNEQFNGKTLREDVMGGIVGFDDAQNELYRTCLESNGGVCKSEVTNGGGTNTGASLRVTCTTTAADGTTGTGSGAGGTAATGDVDTCVIKGVGWIVCPVADFLGTLTDGAYTVVEKLLVFHIANDPFSTDPAQNPVYTVWSNIRDIANLAFVVAFFVIIFSQATSVGISSYGIRKTLPRVFVAAIMVNLSYYICVFAVDLSNIVGASMQGIISSVPLQGIGETLPDGGTDQWGKNTLAVLAGTTTAGVALGVLAPVLQATLFAFIATALMAILTAVIVLTARQAFLIILIIISPLAFVAYILPNTDGLFEKWRKYFTTLLIMYPLVALIFYGSRLASEVMRMTAPNDGAGALIELFSLGVSAFPLFGVPFIVKFSGGLIGRIAGMANNPEKGVVDRARNWGKNRQELFRGEAGHRLRNFGLENGKPESNSRFKKGVRTIGDFRRSREGQRKKRLEAVESEYNRAGAIALAEGDPEAMDWARKAAGVSGSRGVGRLRAGAIYTQKEEHSKEVSAEKTRLKDMKENENETTLMKYLTTNPEAQNDITMEAAASILASGTHGTAGVNMLANMLRNREFELKNVEITNDDGTKSIVEKYVVKDPSPNDKDNGFLAKHKAASEGLVEAVRNDPGFISKHPDAGYNFNDVNYIQNTINGTNDVAGFSFNNAIATSASKVLKLSGEHADAISKSPNFTYEVAEIAFNNKVGMSDADPKIQAAIKARLAKGPDANSSSHESAQQSNPQPTSTERIITTPSQQTSQSNATVRPGERQSPGGIVIPSSANWPPAQRQSASQPSGEIRINHPSPQPAPAAAAAAAQASSSTQSSDVKNVTNNTTNNNSTTTNNRTENNTSNSSSASHNQSSQNIFSSGPRVSSSGSAPASPIIIPTSSSSPSPQQAREAGGNFLNGPAGAPGPKPSERPHGGTGGTETGKPYTPAGMTPEQAEAYHRRFGGDS